MDFYSPVQFPTGRLQAMLRYLVSAITLGNGMLILGVVSVSSRFYYYTVIFFNTVCENFEIEHVIK
jgi:hypothetical protein